MNTFRDLLQLIVASHGDVVEIQWAAYMSPDHYDIRSEISKPVGYLTRNTVELLRFKFHRRTVTVRPSGKLRCYRFAIDEPLTDLVRIKHLSNEAITAMLRYQRPTIPKVMRW